MRPDYERYGHLGVPLNPCHTAIALDAADALTKDLTRTVRNAAHLLRNDGAATLNTVLATFWADLAERHVDELRTKLADILSDHMLDDDDEDEDDLTADDGWHHGGVMTATPDGVVVSEADPDERDELVICF
jgi:hypothetical protein